MNHKGILVIKNSEPPNTGIDAPCEVICPFEKAFGKYRGINGDPWPEIDLPKPDLADGLASLDDFTSCREYWNKAKEIFPNDKIDLLAIGNVEERDDLQFSFLGYDCGWYEEYSNFSALQNDLLFGGFKELESFHCFLNKNLLFTSRHDVDAFLARRYELFLKGYPLETYDFEYYAIPIFSIRQMESWSKSWNPGQT